MPFEPTSSWYYLCKCLNIYYIHPAKDTQPPEEDTRPPEEDTQSHMPEDTRNIEKYPPLPPPRFCT